MLNLALLALAALLGWRIRENWLEAEGKQAAVLKKQVPPAPVLPPEPVPAVEPPTPADYIEVAQRTLFSPDRDPNVIVVVEAPPPPPPPPPRPPLPRYHGQMALGDPVVILSLDGKLKRYRAGDKIGEFTVAAWDESTLTLEWNGERIQSELEDLKPSPEELARAKSAPAPAPQAAAQAPNTGQMGSKGREEGKGRPGRQVGAFRTCEPGDTSPAGTVVEGYRKVTSVGLMGPECHWEPIN